MDAGDQERFRSGTFASVAKRIAFGALYTVLVASASIVGFSVLRSGHDAEPAIAGVQLPISGGSGTEALGASGAAAGREAAAETAIPEKQVMSADASQALRLLPPGEPDSAGPEPAEPILVGVQEKAFAAQQEAEARPRTDVGQPDASEPSTVPAKAPGGSGHEPLTLETQSPSVTPAGPAKTAPHLDRPEAEQPKAEEMLQAAPAVPTRNVSAAVPAPTNAVRSRGARAPRGYAGSRSSISRRTAVKHPQPIYYYGQRTGSYYMDPARGYGYGYGGLVPHSDTGN